MQINVHGEETIGHCNFSQQNWGKATCYYYKSVLKILPSEMEEIIKASKL
jgi:hypothetical protein